jgi:colanic acid/amylovoran biosynthesis glycosyltransferase
LHTGVVDSEGDRDGLPNVIPEAFSFQLPVVAFALPGVLEAVKHEETGLVVEGADSKKLAAAIQRLAADPGLRVGLGNNGRKWAEENFSVRRNTLKLAEAMRDACGRGRLSG